MLTLLRLGARPAACLLVVSVFGCGSSSDSASNATAFVNEYCRLMMACCAQAGFSTDPGKCQQLLGGLTYDAKYDPKAGEACLAAARKASQNGTVCPSSTDPSYDDACDGVFDSSKSGGGTKQPGETCSASSDCAKSAEGKVTCYSSYGSGGSTTKTCVVQIDGKAGDTPCLWTRDGNVTMSGASSSSGPAPTKAYVCDRAKGIYCDSETKACKAVGQAGDPCKYSESECVADTYCDSSAKKCTPRLPAGSACEGSYSSKCEKTLYCDATTKTCKAKAANGASCTTMEQCQSGWCENGKCKSSGGGESLFCVGG